MSSPAAVHPLTAKVQAPYGRLNFLSAPARQLCRPGLIAASWGRRHPPAALPAPGRNVSSGLPALAGSLPLHFLLLGALLFGASVGLSVAGALTFDSAGLFRDPDFKYVIGAGLWAMVSYGLLMYEAVPVRARREYPSRSRRGVSPLTQPTAP